MNLSTSAPGFEGREERRVTEYLELFSGILAYLPLLFIFKRNVLDNTNFSIFIKIHKIPNDYFIDNNNNTFKNIYICISIMTNHCVIVDRRFII